MGLTRSQMDAADAVACTEEQLKATAREEAARMAASVPPGRC